MTVSFPCVIVLDGVHKYRYMFNLVQHDNDFADVINIKLLNLKKKLLIITVKHRI